MIDPFRIDIPEHDLQDLRDRLGRTRWPDEQEGVGRDQGLPLSTARDLAARWREDFDWRAQEARLNELAQFRAVVDGAHVHFVHERAAHPDAPALLLLHGWPSTFADYADLVGPLRECFHVVVPSLPGFAFSGPTPSIGWGVRRMASALAELMTRLGYERFGVHGADTGAAVGRWVGVDHPDLITTLHTCGTVGGPGPDDELTEEERTRAGGRDVYMREHSGYALEQSQRPQTLGYALTDSPAGQLAWIAEKLHDWADATTPIPDAAILTTASLYWLTATATSSARVYWEGGRDGSWFLPPEPSTAPTAVAVFPHGLAGNLPIRRFAERVNTISRWTEFDRGGHFPALEVPELLLADLLETYA
jgi:epoxide hydrolase